MRPVRGHRLLWILLASALVVRLASGVWWQTRLAPGQSFHFPDSESYWVLGQHIAEGQAYEYLSPQRKVFRSPGYPLLLAGVFGLMGQDASVMWGRALSAVCGTAAVAGVFCWTHRAFDLRTAYVAAGIATVYPGAVAMSGLVLSEAPFMAAMVWQLVAWQRAQSAAHLATSQTFDAGSGVEPRKRLTASFFGYSAAAGLLGGIATLIRPSWLLFTPLAALLPVLFGDHRKRRLAFAVCATGVMALTMLPWWIRNWNVTGHFVATTLQVGASLYDGLHPKADGGSDMSYGDAFAKGRDLTEYELNAALQAAAWDWALQHPKDAIQLAGVKLTRLWNVWPNEASFRTWSSRLIVAGSFIPVVVLAMIGGWRYRHRRAAIAATLAPAAYLTALHIIFVSSIRYREPAMLMLVPLAASALSSIAQKTGSQDPTVKASP